MSSVSKAKVKTEEIEMVMTRLKLNLDEVDELSKKLRINKARLLTVDELAGRLKLTLENQLAHIDWIWSEECISIGRAAYCRQSGSLVFVRASHNVDFEAYAIYVGDSRIIGCGIMS
jgi:hypothetical protein